MAEGSSTPAESVDPNDLERAELPTVFRGADQQVVQRLLRLAAAEIRRLRAESDQLRETAGAADEPDDALDEEALTARLGEEAAMVLTAAHEAAAQVRTRTEEKVARLLREAQDEAVETREHAERDRALMLDAAREESEAIVAGADRIRHEAVGRVEAEIETARLRAKDLVAEAQTRRSEILGDLEARQRVLLDELAELDRMRADAAALFDRVADGLGRQSARLRGAESAPAVPAPPSVREQDAVEESVEAEAVAVGESVEVEAVAVEESVEAEAVAVEESVEAEAVAEPMGPEDSAGDEGPAAMVGPDDPVGAGSAEDSASSPIRVSKGRRRRRSGDGLPRGDVSVFRVEPTDEIEIVRVVDDDGETTPTPLSDTTATGPAGDPAETPDLVLVAPSLVERAEAAVVEEVDAELAIDEVEDVEAPVIDMAEDADEAPVIDMAEDAGEAPVIDVTEPRSDGPVIDLSDGSDDAATGGGAPASPRRTPLLEPDDLPVRLSAGGPLDPQPGEYVLGSPDAPPVEDGPAAAEAGTTVLAERAVGVATPVDHDGPTFLDGIFTRLRAERTARTEAAREVLAAPAEMDQVAVEVEPDAAEMDQVAVEAEPDAAEMDQVAVEAEPIVAVPVPDDLVEPTVAVPVPDHHVEPTVAELFDRRNGLLVAHGADLSSRLKRVLADQQNVVLDGLHRGQTIDELGPEVEVAFRTAVIDDLAAAATAGSTLVGEAFVVDVDHLAYGLAEQLTSPLFRRLLSASDDAGSGVASRVRSIFREWRSERIGPLAEGFVAAALAQGALAGSAPDAMVRWHCDPGYRCAEGADNELAGSVQRGEPFPTGHLLAPAYLGCRCFVVPVEPPT